MTPSKQLFEEASELAFGDRWKSSIARALGPYHPAGARHSIDRRLIHRWMEDEGVRPIPDWVWPALANHILPEKAKDILEVSSKIVKAIEA